MNVVIWGSRGSIASTGPETIRYGGNTACVGVSDAAGTICMLDAGTGLRRAGLSIEPGGPPVHILLTHLHMDHIQGLGFFRPLFEPNRELHIWGPPSTTQDLRTRLTRYLSPPLFPVRIRDLDSRVELHDIPARPWRIGAFEVAAATVIHPGPTVGYRISAGDTTIAYLPDHEPALGGRLSDPRWSSGHDLAAGVDLVIHDAQYTPGEYAERVGWGHSTFEHAVALAEVSRARRLLLFHHDPDHHDETIDRLLADAGALARRCEVDAAREGTAFSLDWGRQDGASNGRTRPGLDVEVSPA